MMFSERDQVRFLEKIEVSEAGCWKWTRYCNRDGYGLFRMPSKHFLAHRVSYEMFVEQIPEGLVVCHSCDNPPCVNPEHLFLGTQADNVEDAGRKGRNRGYKWSPEKVRKGDNHWSSRLTEADVIAIRERYAAGELQKTLAHEYGVCHQNIHLIVKRKSWAHC